jgi:signal transduction histidine kinase
MQKRFTEAFYWTSHLEELLSQYQQLADAEQTFFDKQEARLNFYRATTLEGLGQHAEATKAYNKARQTDYATTNEGKLEATTYLMSAKRFEEAAHNFEVLDVQLNKYGVKLSLDIIQHYLLPKYRANVGAQQLDSALLTGMRICTALDSAIVQTQQDEALELATLYNLQQKETVFVQQKADMARQRMVATIVALALIILFFVLIIYFRHKAAMRLEMAYYQLEIANEKTKESSRMKTSFIHQMSHEIRTPLNILSGFAQIISTPDIKLDEETKQDMNRKIMENTIRITELVNKMLEMSEASSRTVIERTENIPAVQIAVEAMNVFPIGEKYKIPIDLQLDENVNDIRIQTNEQAATRALVLLLDNAEIYTKEGAIHLKVDIPSEKIIRYIVEDTGIGVPKAEAEHIFEEFVQLDENKEGTGLGLTVARSLAKRLGGNIVLDTTYTGGARFIMTLPINK